MEEIEILSNDTFLLIYSDPKFRNEVAFACKHFTSTGNFKYWATVGYPKRYIVTEEQIDIAKQEKEKANLEIRKKYKYDLLFRGMGSSFTKRWDDDITNHRIRTFFQNRNGVLFFIEIMPSDKDGLVIDSAINLDDEKTFHKTLDEMFKKQNSNKRSSNEYWDIGKEIIKYREEFSPTHNYANICRDQRGYKCTQSDIVKLINEVFECDFQRMIIDEYDLIMANDNDILCYSPGPDYKIIEEIEEIDDYKLIEKHRSKYPLPFEELTKYSSYDQTFGKTPQDYTPDQRFERWKKVMSQTEIETQEYFQDTEACENCIHLDLKNFWCKDYGLPNAYNPILKGLGMACCGAGKEVKPIQLSLFE